MNCEDAFTSRALFYIEKIIRWFVDEKYYLNEFEIVIVVVVFLLNRYSTFVVKYSWCFLLFGSVICLVLGISAVLLRDLPDFNDPTKVKIYCPLFQGEIICLFIGFYSTG
jgi:hypothetical protein